MGRDGERSVEVPDARAVQIGDNSKQYNYFILAAAARGDAARSTRIAFSGEIDSPYRGLLPFGEDDAPFFFGRETAAADILERLSRIRDAPAILIVSGSSGAGKSSVLRAGVLPRITEAGLVDASRVLPWPCLALSPAH